MFKWVRDKLSGSGKNTNDSPQKRLYKFLYGNLYVGGYYQIHHLRVPYNLTPLHLAVGDDVFGVLKDNPNKVLLVITENFLGGSNMFKWVTGVFKSVEDKHIRQRKWLVSFLDHNLFNGRYCSIWYMYAILDEHNLKGDVGEVFKNNPNKLLLHTTEYFLEGWKV